MKRLGIVFAVLVAAVLAFNIMFPSATVRFRLTLDADIDGKPATGSGVIEVSYMARPRLLPNEAEFSINVRGEAVALALGQRGTLFVLLKSAEDSRSGAEWIVLRAFNFPGGALPFPVAKGVSDVRQLSGKVELPLRSVPLLVRFRDINDPLTVEKVDPLLLEKSFGPGVQLTHATLEIVPAGIWPLSWYGITGESITNRLEKQLVWLKATKGGYLDGNFAGGGPKLSNILHGGDFKTGLGR
ncbi:MAG: hypothetical protein JWR89_3816 [Tardiphaga sp.]|uniref:hypothetical protein n=1 Tax=Tardiphaga sp. TaxID=1926292 RepID=UPI002632A5E8|nr:hypothetical protein [Tardiphaga sp.]MDB5503914.1 hypothetical protein [Tardiphaga sp.]